MKTITGRKEEQALFEKVLESKNAEFIAVYGRRRVGKTFLIQSFFSAKKCVFFHFAGTQDGNVSDQIYQFTRVIESTFYDSNLSLQEPQSWTKAFELLTNLINTTNHDKKFVIFFDELPWLAGQKSGFMQALDYYWNRFWSNMPNVKLIVCGSAASWLIDNVLNNKGGLHNRVTGRIALSPFTLLETKEYLKSKGYSYTNQQILELYMVLGGIPYYLNLLSRNLSIPQNIDNLMFNRDGALVDEFSILYSSLFKNAEAYEEIIRVIASKKRGVRRTEILKTAKLSSEGGSFKKRLRDLEISRFIESFTPYGFKKKDSYFIVIDEFSLFYLTWVEPKLSTIRKISKAGNYWTELSQTQSWKSWCGYAFESVCFKHVDQIKKALKINASADIGSWQYIPKAGNEEDGAQIDLLFDRNDNVITICELKYYSEPYKLGKSEAQALLKKIEVFKKRIGTSKQTKIALITAVAPQKTMYSEELIDEVVTLNALL